MYQPCCFFKSVVFFFWQKITGPFQVRIGILGILSRLKPGFQTGVFMFQWQFIWKSKSQHTKSFYLLKWTMKKSFSSLNPWCLFRCSCFSCLWRCESCHMFGCFGAPQSLLHGWVPVSPEAAVLPLTSQLKSQGVRLQLEYSTMFQTGLLNHNKSQNHQRKNTRGDLIDPILWTGFRQCRILFSIHILMSGSLPINKGWLLTGG